ncbi:MAG TPA: prolyl oligopeptidase family serine peptidase [Polyangia bacterium]|nr:prolyl oligopeptidase family serine peptidase [Polyangia bacterium]
MQQLVRAPARSTHRRVIAGTLAGFSALAAVSLAGCAAGRSPVAPAAAVPAPASSPAVSPPPRTPSPAASGYSGLGADSVPAAVIARFAPPALPSELTRRIQSMFDIRAPGGGILSPDGKRLYFAWSVTGVSQVWRLDGPQHFPIQMTGGEDPTTVAAVSPDGAFLVISRDRKGEENPGLYLQPATGGPLVLIQHTPKVQTVLEFISDDARTLVFRANDQKPDSYALYRWDVATRRRTPLFDRDGLWSVEDYRPDGKMLLAKHNGSAQEEFFELDADGKTLTPLFGQGEKENYGAAYAADPDELLVMTPKLGEYRRLYRWSRASRTFTAISAAVPFDLLETFIIDESRRHVFYGVNENGFSRLSALDARSYRPQALPALPAADHTVILSATRDGRYAVVGQNTGRSPNVSYVIDFVTGEATQWQLPGAPELDTTQFASAALESYPARDGTPIPMLVRRPPSCAAAAADPCPVIVTFHGGPEGQSVPGFNTRAQLFVDAGYVYVEPNVRGSEGYGKTWFHADDGPKRLDIITDIEDAARFVRAHWRKQGKEPKVAIFGGSYGGYSALIGMTMFAGAYDAGASVVGIGNLVTFLRNTAPYRRILRANEYGDLERDHDALVKLSPTTYVDRVKAPILLIQGASDPRVPVGEAIQIHDALAAKGVPVKLIIFPNEGHGAQRRENQVLQYGHVLQFFDAHLK